MGDKKEMELPQGRVRGNDLKGIQGVEIYDVPGSWLRYKEKISMRVSDPLE